MSDSPPPQMSTWMRLAIEMGPLVLFLIASGRWGIYVATVVFMVAVLVALAVSYRIEHKFAMVPLISASFVFVFGGLTLWLHDDTFIKIKVTLINVLFSAMLLGGLAFKRLYIKQILSASMQLDEIGWRKLTVRWGLFFLTLAVLNEIVRRNVDTQTWVNFKVWGVLVLSMVFMFAQMPLIKRHSIEGTE